MADSPKPTAKQLRELRRLAESTGTTFSPPKTRAQASGAIAAMRRRRHDGRIERLVERDDVISAVRAGTLASAPRDDEIIGYGSNAHWANAPR